MDFSLSTYYPIFIYLGVVIGFAVTAVVLPALISPKRKTPVKQMPYESGMDPIGDARQRFDVRYYLVAIVFLLFDVELLFLYPWAVAQWSQRPTVAVASVPATVGAPGAPGPVLAGVPPELRDLV